MRVTLTRAAIVVGMLGTAAGIVCQVVSSCGRREEEVVKIPAGNAVIEQRIMGGDGTVVEKTVRVKTTNWRGR